MKGLTPALIALNLFLIILAYIGLPVMAQIPAQEEASRENPHQEAMTELFSPYDSNPLFPTYSNVPLLFDRRADHDLSALESTNVELVAHIGGEIFQVAHKGAYAYAGAGTRLVILDTSNPAQPALIGQTSQLSDIVMDIEVEGNYAYIVNQDGLYAINVSDPTIPTVTGFHDTTSGAKGVVVVNNLAYIADTRAGLRIVDVTNPAILTEVGYYSSSNISACDVAVAGDYAYISDCGARNVRIIDISDPYNPAQVGYVDTSYTPGAMALSIAVANGYAYVAQSEDGLTIVDVSDPTNPIEVPFSSTFNRARSVATNGNYAYVADRSSGLWVIDISDPTSPTEVGLYDTGGAVDVAVTPGYALVADDSGNLRVADISSPANPVEIGLYDTSGYGVGLAVTGTHIYSAAKEDGILVIDISNPTIPIEIGSFATTARANDVAVIGNYAYVVTYAGFSILNVVDPSTPYEVGFLHLPGTAIEVVNDYAYITDGCALYIVDISDPTHQTMVSYINTGYIYDVAIMGNYAYVVEGSPQSALRLFDISTPSAPTEISSYQIPSYSVDAVGNYAYTLSSLGLLQIIDVSDPLSPAEVAVYPMNTSTYDVTIQQDHAYIASSRGLDIVNVSDPTAPFEAGFYDLIVAYGGSVAAIGCYAYRVVEYEGIYILRFGGACISGRVYDGNKSPIAGVTLTTNNGETATTDANGYYTFTDLITGTYTLTPTKIGHTFSPPLRTVSVAPDAAGQDFCGGQVNHDLVLAQCYAPYLYSRAEETHWPIGINPAVSVAELHFPPGGMLPRPPNLDDLDDPPYNDKDSFLNFPCIGAAGSINAVCDGTWEGAERYWKSVKEDPAWYPQIYARVKRYPWASVIQYWFFYYDNHWLNHHEGDWEMIEVVLDANETPLLAAYSQHGVGTRRLWEYVNKEGGTHPKVYYATGSHASYFRPYSYRPKHPSPLIPQLVDDEPGAVPVPIGALTLLSESEPWLAFEGRWGKLEGIINLFEFDDGPPGPAYAREKLLDMSIWDSPYVFGMTRDWDELADHNINKLFCRSSYPGDVFLRDRDGKSVGRLPNGNGMIVEEIPTSEYIDNSWAQQRTILVHKPRSFSIFDYDYYQCEVSNLAIVPPAPLATAHSNDTVMAPAPITITYNLPDYESNQIINVEFANVTLPISATAVISSSSKLDHFLLVDADDDGVVDYNVKPTSVLTEAIDFTPPATIIDLTVVDAEPGSVTLSWTAPGDDGDSGTATAYDIRYYTEPITPSNWMSATTVVSSPVPAASGTTEVLEVSGAPSGTLYFAVQSVDDAFQFSGISNVTEVDVPYHRVFLPIIRLKYGFRHNSYIAPVCLGTIAGFGWRSCLLGVEDLVAHPESNMTGTE